MVATGQPFFTKKNVPHSHVFVEFVPIKHQIPVSTEDPECQKPPSAQHYPLKCVDLSYRELPCVHRAMCVRDVSQVSCFRIDPSQPSNAVVRLKPVFGMLHYSTRTRTVHLGVTVSNHKQS